MIGMSNGSSAKWKGILVKYFDSHILQKLGIEEDSNYKDIGIHLAIFNEPFKTLIFSGEKTIESRFSINRIGPFSKVVVGDLVFVKESAGPICGYFIASSTKYFRVSSNADLKKIEVKYASRICSYADVNFWQKRNRVKYVSLIGVSQVQVIEALKIGKRDRLSWVTIRPSNKIPHLNL